LTSGVNFTNIFEQLLCAQIPKEQKLDCLLTLLGSLLVKGARKHVGEIDIWSGEKINEVRVDCWNYLLSLCLIFFHLNFVLMLRVGDKKVLKQEMTRCLDLKTIKQFPNLFWSMAHLLAFLTVW